MKILGHPVGQSASFFELHLFRLVPGLKIDFFEKLPQVSRVQCVNVCPMLPVGVGRLFRPPPGSFFRPPPFSLGVGRLFRPLFRPPKTVPSTLIPPSTIIEGFRVVTRTAAEAKELAGKTQEAWQEVREMPSYSELIGKPQAYSTFLYKFSGKS